MDWSLHDPAAETHRSEEHMDKQLQVTVFHGDRAYQTAVNPAERVDQLLLRSVYHFGIDPEDKEDYLLKYRGSERGDRGVYLDRPVGDQLTDGAQLVLERDDTDNRRISTGRY